MLRLHKLREDCCFFSDDIYHYPASESIDGALYWLLDGRTGSTRNYDSIISVCIISTFTDLADVYQHHPELLI